MTIDIDEEIKKAREVAERIQKQADKQKGLNHGYYIFNSELANEYRQRAEWLEELKYFEDLEEKGLLVKLPCKIGDTVYVTEDVYGKGELEITEYRVECMRTGDNFSMTFDALEHDECLEVTFETMDIGRTVFLSYAEAEKELKRLEGAE